MDTGSSIALVRHRMLPGTIEQRLQGWGAVIGESKEVTAGDSCQPRGPPSVLAGRHPGPLHQWTIKYHYVIMFQCTLNHLIRFIWVLAITKCTSDLWVEYGPGLTWITWLCSCLWPVRSGMGYMAVLLSMASQVRHGLHGCAPVYGQSGQ